MSDKASMTFFVVTMIGMGLLFLFFVWSMCDLQKQVDKEAEECAGQEGVYLRRERACVAGPIQKR